ncbi:MAG: mechanosensitive ion channel family protein [Candidatus Promineifilaceae bacterium]|jgi:small conductance mechanosensitive channel
MTQLYNLFRKLDESLEFHGMPKVWNIFWALFFLIVGRWLSRRARTWYRIAINKLDMTLNEGMVDLGEYIIHYGILIASISLALVTLGIPIESLFLVFLIILIIVSVILQPILSNLAATIVFVAYQTYKVGDWLEITGTYGQVKELQLFATVIKTIQKNTVTIPNGEILKNQITNFSRLGYRRADMLFSISYKDDILEAKQLIQEILQNDDRVLNEPPAIIGVQELGDNGVQFNVWPFVDMPEYFNVIHDVSEQVKLRFDKAGITIPFQQQQLHFDGEIKREIS